MVLVTLRGCHLLDGLVACDSVEARKEIVRCSGEEIVRGTVLTRGDREEQLYWIVRVIELAHLWVGSCGVLVGTRFV